jgi:hypothetical protein
MSELAAWGVLACMALETVVRAAERCDERGGGPGDVGGRV